MKHEPATSRTTKLIGSVRDATPAARDAIMRAHLDTVAPIGACSRCGVETDGRMICDRCRRAIFKQAQRLGTLTAEEIAAYANQP